MVNEFLKRHKQPKIGTDIAVPADGLKQMMDYYNQSLSEAGLNYLIFGHIGDCHMHVNILPENEAQKRAGSMVYKKFIEKALSLGGTVSAEHGIGKVKHAYLEKMYGVKAITEMAQLKKLFDPKCILNLDNIFPRRILGQ
jgi:D-lactate dehydrogenase (cytochrome)